MGHRLGTPVAVGVGSYFDAGLRRLGMVDSSPLGCCLVPVAISGREPPGRATNTREDRQDLKDQTNLVLNRFLIVLAKSLLFQLILV